jgi:hypothetical protein
MADETATSVSAQIYSIIQKILSFYILTVDSNRQDLYPLEIRIRNLGYTKYIETQERGQGRVMSLWKAVLRIRDPVPFCFFRIPDPIAIFLIA